MGPRQLAAVVALVCLVAPVARADTVILKNGVELRNVKVVEEQEHTIKVNIIDYTNVVLGRGKISRIEKEGGAVVTAPPAGEAPSPTPAQPQQPAPQAQTELTSRNVYRLSTDEQGKFVEIIVDLAKDGTAETQVKAPSGMPGDKERVYAVTAEGGDKIEFAVQWDDLGEPSAVTVNPPAPPRESPKDVSEHIVKDVNGNTLKIRTRWDWNTRELLDLQFLP
jgi:hypothetical protein